MVGVPPFNRQLVKSAIRFFSFDQRSERIDEFDGEEAGFLGQGLGARPVAGFAGFVGLGQEAANFFLQILLRGV